MHSTSNISKWKTDGLYTFYFAESELGDPFNDEDLFAFDHTTGLVSPVATLFDTPFNSEITPLGVIDEELYFIGKLENEVGKELYKINLGFKTTSTLDNEPEKVTLEIKGNQRYLIDTDLSGIFQVEVHSVDGSFLESLMINPQTPFEVKSKGLIFISIYNDQSRKTFRVYH